jgi:hypothetical protein
MRRVRHRPLLCFIVRQENGALSAWPDRKRIVGSRALANSVSLPVRCQSRARHFACLPLRNNPLEEPEKYFNLKIILGNPKDWAKTGDAGEKAPTKGVFGRKVLRQSIADMSVVAPYVPSETITQHSQCAQGTPLGRP